MKRNIFFIIIIYLLFGCNSPRHLLLEEPKHKSTDPQYIQHFAYTLLYNEENEQADWVAYQLTSDELIPNFKRTNKFKIDTLVLTGTAENSDYKGSGYDRGHLAPAADMVWNKQAMEESFFYSNISPQMPGFNRGIWKKLEEQVRIWAKEYGSVYITTGGICSPSGITIGTNKVKVPDYFYKTMLVFNDTIKASIGFIFPNEKCEGKLMDYAVSIDSVETLTNIDYYPKLPIRIENKIENTIAYWLLTE